MECKLLYAKLTRRFLRKWWLIIVLSIGLLVCSSLVFFFFNTIRDLIIDTLFPLEEGSVTYNVWRKPPVSPIMRMYIYNVTNADEFLNYKQKPIVNELGPYTYSESWEKVNLVQNANGTVSFNQRRIFTFRPELSAGSEQDVVVVLNIPLLGMASKMASETTLVRETFNFVTNFTKWSSFIRVPVGDFLWGYDDPAIQVAKKDFNAKFPFEKFGLIFDRNGTSADNLTVYTGADDISKLGKVSRFNGLEKLTYYKTDECNMIDGTDGTILPPHLNKDSKIFVFDKSLCRKVPLIFQKEVTTYDNIKAYRFSPPKNVFDGVCKNPENDCYCRAPPCAPDGTFNISSCLFANIPVLLSFPHYYLGNPELRNAVVGMSPPDQQTHEFYMDVQPETGVPLAAQIRLQMSLAVTHVNDLEAVAQFPAMIFPILWFEEGFDRLPDDIVSLIKWATEFPTIIRYYLLCILTFCGIFFLLTSIFCLIRSSNRREIMTFPNVFFHGNKDDSTKK